MVRSYELDSRPHAASLQGRSWAIAGAPERARARGDEDYRRVARIRYDLTMLGLPARGWRGAAWRRLVAVAVCALCLGAATRAGAQERRFEMQLFLPPAGGGATFGIDRTDTPRHLNAVFGVAGSYALEPFTRGELPGLEAQPVVRHLIQLEAMAALGLFEFLELGVMVPVGIIDAADGQADTPASFSSYSLNAGLGDVRLSAKVPIVRGDFSLAARFLTHLPTGDFNNYLGMEYWIATPSVLLGFDPGPLTISSEIGYRLRQRRAIAGFEQDDELLVSLGVTVPVVEELELIGETQLRVRTDGRNAERSVIDFPWEVDAGVRIHPARGLSIEVGAGTGILAGWGTPPLRVLATLRFATDQGQECPAGPEDFDGFEDGDFCADPDNDGDQIEDAVDECVNDAEDHDRFADDDGCPDTDNDADGVSDAEDACPTQSEDRDGFADDDGCPEPDNDEDGVADGLDRCPMEPEDRDGYEDEDGCPEPGPEAASVTVTDTRILISERIYFDFDRDTIRQVSAPMLDEVARVLRELPASLRVRVDGYTDTEGVRAYNVDLSYRRARAVVEYLVGRGVARSRLEYRGYGPDNPVGPNDSPEGRALNRRVEFTILQEGESAGDGRRRGR